MPYVITTKRPRGCPTHAPGSVEGCPTCTYPPSRRAVATLDEKDVAPVLFNWREGDGLDPAEYRVLDAVYEGGGTLPDGTVIEVERMSWAELASADERGRTPYVNGEYLWDTAAILDAYNARQA